MTKRRPKLNAFGISSPKRHIALHHLMLESPAWQNLKPPARALLIEIWQRYTGFNNGAISFSHREAAERLQVGKNTPFKLFRDLEEKGFIVAMQRGSFDWKEGAATIWRITALKCGNDPPTKDFMRWGKNKTRSRPEGPRKKIWSLSEGP